MPQDRFYKPGSFWRIDDRSGFKVRAENTRKEWTNLIVATGLWEARQPQDFVKGVTDDQSVPDPRPRQLDVFLGPLQTTTTAACAAGTTLIPLASAVRFLIGDNVEIMLDTNEYFSTTVSQVPSTTSIRIPSPGLPYSAASGNIVTDITAMAAVNIG